MLLDINEKYINLIIGRIEKSNECNELYRELLNEDNFSKKLKLYLKSQGGSIQTMIELLNIFKNYNVETHLISEAKSAGTFIFLAGQKRIAYEGSIFLAHTPKMDAFGDIHLIDKKIDIFKKKTNFLVEKYYKPYFSRKEIEYIMNGGEIYLTHRDLYDRKMATEVK